MRKCGTCREKTAVENAMNMGGPAATKNMRKKMVMVYPVCVRMRTSEVKGAGPAADDPGSKSRWLGAGHSHNLTSPHLTRQ